MIKSAGTSSRAPNCLQRGVRLREVPRCRAARVGKLWRVDATPVPSSSIDKVATNWRGDTRYASPESSPTNECFLETGKQRRMPGPSGIDGALVSATGQFPSITGEQTEPDFAEGARKIEGRRTAKGAGERRGRSDLGIRREDPERTSRSVFRLIILIYSGERNPTWP